MYALAFDLGKVLFDFDYNIALDKIRGRINTDPDFLLKQIYDNNFGLDFERGQISAKEFYQQFKKLYQLQANYFEFSQIWSDIFSPNQNVINLVKKLKSRFPVYVISNINELHYKHLAKEYPQVFTLFKSLILSYKVKAVKPETKIYEFLKAQTGKEYSQIIYIDDRADLIAAAKKLKINSIQFENYPKLIGQLTQFIGEIKNEE